MEWRPIPQYDGYYASRCGQIGKFTSRGIEVKKQSLDRTGYYRTTITYAGKRHMKLTHRLVAKAFWGDKSRAFPVVRHLDGNSHNNTAENLRWGCHSANASDRVSHAATPKTHCPTCRQRLCHDVSV